MVGKIYKNAQNIVEAVYQPAPMCESLEELVPKTGEYSNKHVPYLEKVDGGYLVKVGKEEYHPMTPEHYIVYIEIEADGILMRKYLKPGDVPEAFFKTDAEVTAVRELCNNHGLWAAQ